MSTQRFLRTYLPLAFLLLAVVEYFWVRPLFEKLPEDYVAETKFSAKGISHHTPTAPAEEFESIVRRRDQTLSSDATHSIIQGDAHWLTPAGVVVFEVLSLYGVDRRTRENLSAYGNESRMGQYLFPPETEKKTYQQWDPMYAGQRVAKYDHSEQLDGLPVYVFTFVVDGLDETSGYSVLPDVPERYGATTYAKGRLWVEPHSGLMVDYEDEGVSYFVEPKTGDRAGEIFRWMSRYTPETRAEQFQAARTKRLRQLVLDRGIPGALVAGGLLLLILPALTRRRESPEVVS